MALETTVALQVRARLTSIIDLVTADAPLAQDYKTALATGTGADQADKVFSDTRTVAASSNDDIDLAGPLLDAFGAAITFARVKALIIIHKSGTSDLTIGGAPANPWITMWAASGDGLKLRANGTSPQRAMFIATAPDASGYAVTAGTGDILRVAAGAGTGATYDIIIVGSSA